MARSSMVGRRRVLPIGDERISVHFPSDRPAGDALSTERIGLIGAGLLGSAIAQRLSAAGFRVISYDVDASRRTVDSAGEVAHTCTRIFLSLPDSTVSDRILCGIPAGRLVIDTTTGDPDQMAALAERCAAADVAYIDACVGGSSQQVRDGDAVMMIGASQQDLDRASELVRAVTSRAFHVGPPGAGARMKLVFNLVLGLNRAVLAEGLAFAEKAGVDPRGALDVLLAGPAYSRVMDSKGAKMLDRDFTPQARLSQHLKDVRLMLDLAEVHGARLPLTRQHRAILEELEEAGAGGLDNSAVIDWFR